MQSYRIKQGMAGAVAGATRAPLRTMKAVKKLCATLVPALLLAAGAAHAADAARPAQATPAARTVSAARPVTTRSANIQRPAARQLKLALPASTRAADAAPVAAKEASDKPEDLETQRLFGNFKREGLPFAVLAESRSFRVAAGISPRKVAGIYFVRKAGDQP